MTSYKVTALVSVLLLSISTIRAMNHEEQPKRSLLPPVKRSNPVNSEEVYNNALKRLKQLPQDAMYKATFLSLLPQELQQEVNKRLVTYLNLDLTHSIIYSHPVKDLVELAFLVLFKNNNLKLSEKRAVMELIRTLISSKVEELELVQDRDDTRIQLKKHLKIVELFKHTALSLELEEVASSSPGIASEDRPECTPRDLYLYFAYNEARNMKNDFAKEFLVQHNALEKEAEYKRFKQPSYAFAFCL